MPQRKLILAQKREVMGGHQLKYSIKILTNDKNNILLKMQGFIVGLQDF
jgi:hypothetical protein